MMNVGKYLNELVFEARGIIAGGTTVAIMDRMLDGKYYGAVVVLCLGVTSSIAVDCVRHRYNHKSYEILLDENNQLKNKIEMEQIIRRENLLNSNNIESKLE